jgi:hypothetical protein
MNHQSTKSSSTSSFPRCQHHTRTGRRCRQSGSDHTAGLCPKHARPLQNQPAPADLAAALTSDSAEFKSAHDIHDFLSKLLVLLAQNRISARRAAVLAYITNQLLRTLSAIDREDNLPSGEPAPGGPQLIWDIPRPNRDPVENPS